MNKESKMFVLVITLTVLAFFAVLHLFGATVSEVAFVIAHWHVFAAAFVLVAAFIGWGFFDAYCHRRSMLKWVL